MKSTVFDPSRLRWAVIAAMLVVAFVGLALLQQDVSGASAFQVNSLSDASDSNPYDGRCATYYGVCTLRAAIEQNNLQQGPGLITFAPSITLPATITLTGGEIPIFNDVTIRGPDWGTLTVDANENSRHFWITGSMYDPPHMVDISHLALVNGKMDTAAGGSILVGDRANVTLSSLVFRRNTAEIGGAIHLSSQGDLAVTDTVFDANATSSDGGAIHAQWDTDISITSVVFIGNSATRSGGAVHTLSNLHVAQSTFDENEAEFGGAIRIVNPWDPGDGSTSTRDLVSIWTPDHSNSNTPSVRAGYPRLEVLDSNFMGNRALGGGAIGADFVVTTITNTSFQYNRADGDESISLGGALWFDGGLVQVHDSSFIENLAEYSGGGIHTQGCELRVEGSQFLRNRAMWGGAISNSESAVVIHETAFDQNDASYGGALAALVPSESPPRDSRQRVTYVNNSNRYTQNTASVFGGAIYGSGASIEVSGATFSHNSASQSGGAIYVSNRGGDSDLTIVNSTLSGNGATSGGALYNSATEGIDVSATATISNSTITLNTASDRGGGMANYATETGPAVVRIANSILAGNTASGNAQTADCYTDCFGSFLSKGQNLRGINASLLCPFDSTDIQVDPSDVFVQVINPSLADNGGPTPTHALLPNSPAIDRIPFGVNGCGTSISHDQRGAPRPLGPQCDVGAYEAAVTAIDVAKTVGPMSSTCPLDAYTEVAPGSMVDFCVTITNTSYVTLTTHLLDDDTLGINFRWIVPLAPGDSTTLTKHDVPALGSVVVNDSMLNTTTVTSEDPIFVVPVSATATASAEVHTVSSNVTWSQVLISPRVAVRTFTAMVSGAYQGVYMVYFRVSGGTQFSPEPQPIPGVGQAVFSYTSIAPAAHQPLNCLDSDVVELWVDLNHNTQPDANFEPYWTAELCTAITLASFTAQLGAGATVRLDWQTAVEIDSAGFNLHRAPAPDGPYTQINHSLIPALGMGGGASYSYTDVPPGPGAFYYKLEEVDVDGVSTFYGPVSVEVPSSGHWIYLPTILR